MYKDLKEFEVLMVNYLKITVFAIITHFDFKVKVLPLTYIYINSMNILASEKLNI